MADLDITQLPVKGTPAALDRLVIADTAAGQNLALKNITLAQLLGMLAFTDSATIDFTITAQQVTAIVRDASITVAKLAFDLTETIQDVVGAMLVDAGGTYNDTTGQITVPGGTGGVSDEAIQDIIGAILGADGGTFDWTYNDAGNAIVGNLKPSGVTAGAYTNANITIGADGRITAASSGLAGSIADGSITPAKLSFDPATQTELDAHTANVGNPHGVTKAQVGLGNVPNIDLSGRVATLEGSQALVLPAISNIVTGTPTFNSVTITATTNKFCTLVARLRTTTSTLPDVAATSPDGLNHTIVLNGLVSAQTYLYRLFAQDLAGNTDLSLERSFITASLGDMTAPVVTNIRAVPATDTVLITWDTDDDSDGMVEFRAGSSGAYGQSARQLELTKGHSITVSGLNRSTTYNFHIVTRNLAGLVTTTTDASFTTLAAAQITDNFDTDNRTLWPSERNLDPGPTGTTVQVTGGQLVVKIGTIADGNGRVSDYYDFTGKAVYVKAAQTYAGQASGPRTVFRIGQVAAVGQPQPNSVAIVQDNAALVGVYYRDGAEFFDWDHYVTYDPTQHLYWRIRDDTGSGLIVLEAAPSSAFTSPTVISQFAKTTVVDPAQWIYTQTRTILEAGTYTASTWTGDARFDDYNYLASTASVAPGGNPSSTMPTVANAGWKIIFSEDFRTPVGFGGFPGAQYGPNWDAYPWNYRDSSQNGHYYPEKCFTVKDVPNATGVLDYWLHYEANFRDKDNNLQNWFIVGAPMPRLPAPPVPSGGWTSDHPEGRYNMAYTVRFRADQMRGYKMAWLLWPDNGQWPLNGEIDFPEGDYDASSHLEAFMHRQNGANGGDQDYRDSGVLMSGATYHTCRTVWVAGQYCEFWYNGVRLGTRITSRVPATAMHLVLQCETTLGGFVPSTSVQGHVQLDWVIVEELL
jgi:hypothetical protein